MTAHLDGAFVREAEGLRPKFRVAVFCFRRELNQNELFVPRKHPTPPGSLASFGIGPAALLFPSRRS